MRPRPAARLWLRDGVAAAASRLRWGWLLGRRQPPLTGLRGRPLAPLPGRGCLTASINRHDRWQREKDQSRANLCKFSHRRHAGKIRVWAFAACLWTSPTYRMEARHLAALAGQHPPWRRCRSSGRRGPARAGWRTEAAPHWLRLPLRGSSG
jgi:hypothetical protein